MASTKALYYSEMAADYVLSEHMRRANYDYILFVDIDINPSAKSGTLSIKARDAVYDAIRIAFNRPMVHSVPGFLRPFYFKWIPAVPGTTAAFTLCTSFAETFVTSAVNSCMDELDKATFDKAMPPNDGLRDHRLKWILYKKSSLSSLSGDKSVVTSSSKSDGIVEENTVVEGTAAAQAVRVSNVRVSNVSSVPHGVVSEDLSTINLDQDQVGMKHCFYPLDESLPSLFHVRPEVGLCDADGVPLSAKGREFDCVTHDHDKSTLQLDEFNADGKTRRLVYKIRDVSYSLQLESDETWLGSTRLNKKRVAWVDSMSESAQDGPSTSTLAMPLTKRAKLQDDIGGLVV